jgi:alpha-N-arabinofuranosidase
LFIVVKLFTNMKSHSFAILAVLALGLGSITAQTVIFNENFDGGYPGSFGLSHYSGGSPINTTNLTLTSGGNPNGCWQETMKPTATGDYYAGQVQLMSVTGNTDPNPGDYVFSFDAKGSQAGLIQLSIETWQSNYFTGSKQMNAGINGQLTNANVWQTFSVNLGTITTTNANGATWQLNFAISASHWGGVGPTDVLTVDNIVLTHLSQNLLVNSSANPSAYNAPVTFTAAVVTNGVTASNATGTVVFSSIAGPFSTNAVSGGTATSSALTNLLVGANAITGAYSGGNYPAATNILTQIVNAPTTPGIAQDGLPLYTDNLVNGFQNWSWASVNLLGSSPVHSGNYAIGVTDGGNQALAFNRAQFNSSPFANLTFWVNGGSSGGQLLKISGLLDYNAQTGVNIPALAANTWQQVTIPLATLGVANKPNMTGFWIQGRSGGAQPTFYVDDMQLTPAAAPAMVHLGADAGQVLQPVDARQFGLNTATWDGSLGNSTTLPMLQQIGTRALRWPGGSTSDGYHWASDPAANATFQSLATNLGAQVFTTINYGSGTPAEAAAWVRMANQTNHCGFQYWEIGNECYGSWENDTHAIQHDPYTYATNAVACIQQMKSAYPAMPIKIGVVVVPGEGSYSNNATHFAVNPRTGSTNYGWTPIVLSVMNSLGVTPDFLIYHDYPQYTPSGWTFYSASPDSDPLLLQVAENPSPSNWSDWGSAATDLRQQITDYIGTGTGGGIELCVTENNSDAGAMGRQSTSLVNALYLADSTSALMKTEFRSYIWWDLHNGYETDGNFDPTIYGWRPNGDYGILNAANSPYPTFYAEKLLQNFARPGDSVLTASSDNLLLSAYAVRRTNGALTLLVINKDMTNNLAAQVALTNFVPWSTASLLSYGIPQDQAAETNGAPVLQDLAGGSYPSAANFNYTFAPLSLTLFTFAPGAATVAVQSVQSGQVQLLLQGQPGTPYVIQTSRDLLNWSSVATNTLIGSSASVPVPVPPGASSQFFRAVWQP